MADVNFSNLPNRLKNRSSKLLFNFHKTLLNFLIPSIKTDLISATNLSITLVQGRERILTALLRAAMVLSLFAFLNLLPTLLRDHLWGQLSFYISLMILLWVAALNRQIDYQVRAGLLLVIGYSLGLNDLLNYGLAEDGRVFLFGFCVGAIMLMGTRVGIGALVLSVATIATLGYLISTEQFVIFQKTVIPTPPLTMNGVLISSMNFLFMTGLIMASVEALLRNFDIAWQSERRTANQLQQERDLLEQRVAERTHELAQANAQLLQEVIERQHAQEAVQQTNRMLSQRVDELATLNHISQTVATLTDLPSALNALAQTITQCFMATHTSITLFNQTHTEAHIMLVYQTQLQNNFDLTGYKIPVSHDANYIEYTQGRPIVIGDPQTNPSTQEFHAALRANNTQCLMHIPLQSRGSLIGVMSVSTDQVGRVFTADEVHLAETIAGQITGAMENVRLYAEAQQELAERRQIEQALVQARDHALASSRLKSELLAKVSHELRTPLGAILGYAEILYQELYGPLSNEQQAALKKIIEGSYYLTKQVNELLDQARLDAGKLELNLSNFALAKTVHEIHSQMQVLARAKGLNLTSEIAPDMPDVVLGDPARVQQILVNVVSNAIKFTKMGSVRVYIYRPVATHWAMQVSDTGPGIPLEAQAYIFEPFRQVDGSMTREHGGAGLGLSIVKQLTNLMGGQISLKSEVGQGSTFTVVLPLTPIQEEMG